MNFGAVVEFLKSFLFSRHISNCRPSNCLHKVQPKTRTVLGEWAFTVARLRFGNYCPLSVLFAQLLMLFLSQLKTYSFQIVHPLSVCTDRWDIHLDLGFAALDTGVVRVVNYNLSNLFVSLIINNRILDLKWTDLIQWNKFFSDLSDNLEIMGDLWCLGFRTLNIHEHGFMNMPEEAKIHECSTRAWIILLSYLYVHCLCSLFFSSVLEQRIKWRISWLCQENFEEGLFQVFTMYFQIVTIFSQFNQHEFKVKAANDLTAIYLILQGSLSVKMLARVGSASDIEWRYINTWLRWRASSLWSNPI